MLYKIKEFIQNSQKKKHYAPFAKVIQGILNAHFNYDVVQKELDLPFDTLDEYVCFISDVQFPKMSALDNLKFHDEFQAFESSIKSSFLKDILYPLFLCLLSFILTLSFNKAFAPSILDMMDGFNVSTIKLQIIYSFTRILNLCWVGVMLCLICLIIILVSKDLPTVLYIRHHNKKFFKTVRNILTLRFCFVYQFFINKGLNTQEFIQLSQDVNGIDDIKWLSGHIKRNLEQGIELKDAIDLSYFNPLFRLFFIKGYFNQDLNQSLGELIELLNTMIHQEISQMIKKFKGFVYLYILVFIMIYYVFLFQPLSVLEAIV